MSVRPFQAADHAWADELISAHQGGRVTARLGQLIDPLELPGLVAVAAGERVGLLTWIVVGEHFEIFTLHSRPQGVGAGGALLAAAADLAREQGCRRLWLVTTNDNLDALGFYQRHGLRLCALYAGAVSADRAIKPEIPASNPDTGIPIRDLLELELVLEPPPPSHG